MSRFRVLIIDDEEELATTLVERLTYRDIEAEYALDGISALAKVVAQPYDVVVLDLKLPGISGEVVLRRIKAQFPHLPVIMITGHGTPHGHEAEKPEQAFDIVAKPIGLDALIEKMEAAVKKHE